MGGVGIQQTSLHHSADPACPACEFKMTQAHPELLQPWHAIKSKYPDAHISWTYRDKANQEAAYANHKSNAHYPFSPHNKVDRNGDPQSCAFDLFQINSANPKGCWDAKWCREVYDYVVNLFPYIRFGGNFKSFKDNDHFEVDLDENGNVTLPAIPSDSPIIIPAKKG